MKLMHGLTVKGLKYLSDVTSWRRKLSVLAAAFVLSPALSSDQGFSKCNPGIESAIRVTCRLASGVEVRSSGFLWSDESHVVTNLHAVLPCLKLDDQQIVDSDVSVFHETSGKQSEASLVGVNVGADLVVLRTKMALTGTPLISVKEVDPDIAVWAVGWEEDRERATCAPVNMIESRPIGEILLGTRMFAVLRIMGFPSPDQEVFWVDAALRPGQSGGPVVDDKLRLNGIVQGGLAGGTLSRSWLIPPQELEEIEPVDEADALRALIERLETQGWGTDVIFALREQGGLATAPFLSLDPHFASASSDQTVPYWTLVHGQGDTDNESFLVATTEVSIGQWNRCVAEGGCTQPWRNNVGTSSVLPIRKISPREAESYAEWLSDTLNETVRLPTESEFAWLWNLTSNIDSDTKSIHCLDCSTDVPTGPVSVWRHSEELGFVRDVRGNVAEIVESGNKDEEIYLACGGSWRDTSNGMQDTACENIGSGDKLSWVGFRVVREIGGE